jgi:four helix bundle protein
MRAPARNFRELLVWQKAHELVLAVYALTGTFPKHETYGLSQQLRRAAVSVPANIAEGFRKQSRAEKARYMNIAQASLDEASYYFILAKDLGYAETAAIGRAAEEVSQMLQSYAAAILANHL